MNSMSRRSSSIRLSAPSFATSRRSTSNISAAGGPGGNAGLVQGRGRKAAAPPVAAKSTGSRVGSVTFSSFGTTFTSSGE